MLSPLSLLICGSLLLGHAAATLLSTATPAASQSTSLNASLVSSTARAASNTSTSSVSTSLAGTDSRSTVSLSSISSTAASATSFTSSTTAATGNSLDQCLSSKISWSKEFDSFAATRWTSTITQPTSYLVTSSPFIGSTYYPPQPVVTSCNGIPYASHWLSTLTITSTLLFEEQPFLQPTPTCTLDAQQCHAWWTSSQICSSSQDQATTEFTQCSSFSYEPCPSPTDFSAPYSAKPGERCTFYAGPAALHYWPMTVQGGSFCNQTLTNAPIKETPRVATVGSVTITSPMIAISVAAMYAGGSDLNRWGRSLTDVVVTLPPEELKSQRAGFRTGTPLQPATESADFNFADLPPGHPDWQQWLSADGCALSYGVMTTGTGASSALQDHYCGTIWLDDYNPDIAFPSARFQTLSSEWKAWDCQGYFPLFDPPVALAQVDAVATGSVPAQAQSTTGASPGSTVASPSFPTPVSSLGDESPNSAGSGTTQAGATDPSSGNGADHVPIQAGSGSDGGQSSPNPGTGGQITQPAPVISTMPGGASLPSHAPGGTSLLSTAPGELSGSSENDQSLSSGAQSGKIAGAIASGIGLGSASPARGQTGVSAPSGSAAIGGGTVFTSRAVQVVPHGLGLLGIVFWLVRGLL